MEPNSKEKIVERLVKMGVDEVGAPCMVDLTKVSIGHLHIEYIAEDGDLLMHFFWREPPPPGSVPFRHVGNGFPDQETYAPWPGKFRDIMRETVLDSFRIRDEPRRLTIEWIGELSSWCVTVKGVTRIITPSKSKLKSVAAEIVSQLNS